MPSEKLDVIGLLRAEYHFTCGMHLHATRTNNDEARTYFNQQKIRLLEMALIHGITL